jgi:ketosteroid isomerase-like protein
MAADSHQAEMEQVNRIFEQEVIGNRNFSALERVYTPQARILPPGAEMLTGLDHIRNFWEQAVSSLNIESLTLSTLDMQVSGDTATEIGRAEMHTNQPTSPTVVKYVVVWKREGGSWKWDVDIWNADAETHQHG